MRVNPFARAWAGMLMAVALALNERRFPVAEVNWRRPTSGGKRQGNRTGRSYPEQSARQKLRGLRRAQGGPGITEGGSPKAREA